jgi:hypothetical protein
MREEIPMTSRNRSQSFLLSYHDLSLSQEEVLGESVMMIPDSQRRCDEVMKKLSELMVGNISSASLLRNGIAGGGTRHLSSRRPHHP